VATRPNRQIHLVSRPERDATADNFRLVESTIGEPADGQVLVRHRWLSLDPYMRGRMDDRKSYAAPQPLGQTMQGGTAGEVVSSAHPSFRPGDQVVGSGGWQEYSLVDANQPGALRKVDASRVPLSAYLGVAGMPGVTAWYGLTRICKPQPGHALVVSAASGAVGSVVGQLARTFGCRVVGIAGGPEKCRYVSGELGFDACVDYKEHRDAGSLRAALAAAAPDGFDACFENVGGICLDAALACMNTFGRIAICGLISGYDGRPIPLADPMAILRSRLTVEGFIISDQPDVWAEALPELASRVAQGSLKYRETIAEGLEAAPEAFLGLLRGRNLGKQLVRIS
jgi:NADPH-dependent curcumin reductase CurA